jgi:hypothetical protein
MLFNPDYREGGGRIGIIGSGKVPYPAYTPKPSTHRMHDPGSFVPHIRPKVLTDDQMS